MKNQAGLTLVEVLIVVVILGILTTLAFPAWQSTVQQSRRADAQTAAISIQMAQENFRGNCPFYAQNLGTSNTCGANAGASTVNARAVSNEGHYAMSIQANSASGNAYTIVATPQGDQAADTACSPMTLTVNTTNPGGLRAPAACW
jgi:type IV pilus assembly protein PilE